MKRSLFAALFAVGMGHSAQANLNLFAGSNVGSDERGLAVAELAMPMLAEVGPFFEWSRNTAVGSENRYITGLVGRMTLPWLDFFVDTRAGYGWNSTAPDRAGGSGFNLEFGGGYRFSLPTIDLLPRVGISAVTASDDVPAVNLSIGVAIP